MEVHRWAEEKGWDLTTAIRELTSLGLETATRPGAPSPGDRKEMKKWKTILESALRRGRSPFEPILEKEQDPDVKLLAAVLAELDYETIYQHLKATHDEDEPFVERKWNWIKEAAQSHVKPFMDSLDKLEKRFLARKQVYYVDGYDGEFSWVRWLLSDDVMRALNQETPGDNDIEAVKKLIAARYLVAENPHTPWAFDWKE
jgi:hypothetical protein